MDLIEDLFIQCQTSDKLTDEICLELENLTDDKRYQLVNTQRNGISPLCVAVEGNKLDIVEYLIKVGKAEVDQLCTLTISIGHSIKITPLMFVKNVFVARCLVLCGANLKAVAEGLTPLHWQCVFENYKVIEYLVRKGADVTVPMEDGNTILHCCFKNTELYKLCIRSGANVNAQNKLGQTPMHSAILKGKLWAIEILIQNSADPTIKDNEGFDAIRLACKQRNRKVVDFLATNATYSDAQRADAYELLGGFYVSNHELESGVQCWRMALEIRLNNRGEFLQRTRSEDVPETPPYRDAREILTLDDLDEITNDQHAIRVQTFLHASRILGPYQAETAQSLINICATYVGVQEFHSHCYPMQYCLNLAADLVDKFPQHVKILSMLCCFIVLVSGGQLGMSANGIPFEIIVQLANLTSVTLSCTESNTNYCFLVALLNLMLEMPKTDLQQEQLTDLVERLVRMRIRNKSGHSLLHIAALASHLKMNDLPGLTDHPSVKLLKTIKFPRVPVVNLLIECGHPVDCLSNLGYTPLHFACKKLQVETINCLLDHGAHIDQADDFGFQPIHALKNVKGVNSFKHVTLKCLAANTIVTHEVPYGHLEFPALEKFIETHCQQH